MTGVSAMDGVTDHRGRAIGLHPAGPILLAVGSASVVLTSALYGLAPPAAVMQSLAMPEGSLAGAQRGAVAMHWAGTSGVIGNLVMAAGALLLAIDRALRGDGRGASGWALIVMSLFAFEMVDGITGFASPVAAAVAPAAYPVFRSLYAAFFLGGTFIFGLGAILAIEPRAERGWRRWVAWSAIVEGVAAIISSGVGMAGDDVLAPVVGLSIATGAVSFVLIGLGQLPHASAKAK